jgi:hypothetical protein
VRSNRGRTACNERLDAGPLNHDAEVPFFHFYGGKMHKDVLGETRSAVS